MEDSFPKDPEDLYFRCKSLLILNELCLTKQNVTEILTVENEEFFFSLCWCTRWSISADWKQTSHYAVRFPDMISDNKLQTFNWISSFILLYNSECRIKDEDTTVGFCRFWLRFTILILKCLFSTDFRIEFKTCNKTNTTLPENVSEWELKLERGRWPEPTYIPSPIALCFNKRTMMRHYNNDINNSVY